MHSSQKTCDVNGGVEGVVIRKLYHREKGKIIVLLVTNDILQKLFKNLIDLLHLSICLWMMGRQKFRRGS